MSIQRCEQDRSLRWMIGLFLFVAACCESLAVGDDAKSAASGADAIFAIQKVWPVHIEISAEEYAAMQPRGGGNPFFGFLSPSAPADPAREVHRNEFGMDLPWAVGSISVGEHRFEKVGVRYKGNGTIGDASRTAKKSFKFDLDRQGGDKRFGSSKTINLHCGVTDPSKCRETLGYELYRSAGVPAPRTTLAEVRLTVPGKFDRELLGVYTLVQDVDKSFLRDRFDSDDGLLMKPERTRDFEYKGDEWATYEKDYSAKRKPKPAELSRLLAFAKLVQSADDATFRDQIAGYLNVDGFLRFLAATAYVSNSDSFFALGHNYYLYLHPKTGQLHFMPWDLDRAFANFPIFGTNSQQMDLSLVQPYPGKHRLTDRILAIPEHRENYQRLLSDLSKTAFEKDRLLKLFNDLDSSVKDVRDREIQAAAARKEPTGGNGMFGKPPELPEFIQKRTESVAAQIAGTSKGHVPTSGFGPGGGPPPIGPMLAGPLMQTYDANRDKSLSREEWLAIQAKLFSSSKADSNRKCNLESLAGGITTMLPAPPEGAPPGPPVGIILAGPIMTRADEDKDGAVTAEELKAAANSLFDVHDPNKSGAITEDTLAKLLTSLFTPPRPGRPRPSPAQ